MSFFLKSKKPDKDIIVEQKDFDDDDDMEDSPELKLLEIVEIVTKDTQLEVKSLSDKVNKLIDPLELIAELKAENAQLKAELREEKLYNRELINKLIEKPISSSLPGRFSPTVNSSASSAVNNTAGPKGKLP